MKSSPASIPSREDRAAEARAETQRAESALFREVFDYVYTTLRRLNAPEAERDDLAQKIVIAAYMKRQDYDPGRGPPCLWVRGFVVNILRNSRREPQKTREVLTEFVPELDDERPGAEERYVAEIQRRLLHEEFLPQVDFEARVVVVAHGIDGLDFKIIAQQQGIPLPTVYDRYKRGIKQLEAAYTRHQIKQRAQGLVVMPIAIEQLLAGDRVPSEAPAELVRRTWSRVQRALRWKARWDALRSLVHRHETAVGTAFLAGGVFGAVLTSLLRSPPPPAPVVITQTVSAEFAAEVAPGTAAPSAPLSVLSASLVSSASRRDYVAAQRLFDIAHHSLDRGNLDAALAALEVLDRDFPHGYLASERKLMRAQIAQLQAAGGATAKP